MSNRLIFVHAIAWALLNSVIYTAVLFVLGLHWWVGFVAFVFALSGYIAGRRDAR